MTALGWPLGVNIPCCLFKSSCLALCQQSKNYTRERSRDHSISLRCMACPPIRSTHYATARVSRQPCLLESKSNSCVLLTVLLQVSILFDLLKWICTNQVLTCRGNKFHVSSSKHFSQFIKKLKNGKCQEMGRRNNEG